MKIRIIVLSILALLAGMVVPAWAQPSRIVDQWRYSGAPAHPGFLALTAAGTRLVVLNGYANPGIVELDAGQVIWELKGIQANSARRLANGNNLVADSGAPGPPMHPRVVEFDPEGRIVWQYRLPDRAEAPRDAWRLANGNTLITTPRGVLEVTTSGQVAWQYSDTVLPVSAQRLSDGRTLIVDDGLGTGGRVLEVDSQGQVVWSYTPQPDAGVITRLDRPVAALRLADGGTLITDLGQRRSLEVDGAGQVVRVIDWREIIDQLPVANLWYALPLVNGHTLLSLSYTNGQGLVLQVDDLPVTVAINGQPLVTQPPAQVVQGRTLVPLRAVFEALGAQVDWDGSTATVTAVRGDRQLSLVIGSREALINGQPFQLDVPAQVIQGRTMVPLRFAGEALGARVDWDGITRTANIDLSP